MKYPREKARFIGSREIDKYFEDHCNEKYKFDKYVRDLIQAMMESKSAKIKSTMQLLESVLDKDAYLYLHKIINYDCGEIEEYLDIMLKKVTGIEYAPKTATGAGAGAGSASDCSAPASTDVQPPKKKKQRGVETKKDNVWPDDSEIRGVFEEYIRHIDSHGTRECTQQGKEFRRMDSLARLLERDQICAAVHVVNEQLIISTNHIHAMSMTADRNQAKRLIPKILSYFKNLYDSVESPSHDAHELFADKLEILFEIAHKIVGKRERYSYPKQKIMQTQENEKLIVVYYKSKEISKKWYEDKIESESDTFEQKRIKLISRLIRDFEKLEKSIIDKTSLPTNLIVALRGGNYNISHDDKDGVHAEMRLFVSANSGSYVGISKLGCVHCYLVMQSKGIVTRGKHGQAFPWIAPSFLETNEETIKALLGKEAYETYLKLDSSKKTSLLEFVTFQYYKINKIPLKFGPLKSGGLGAEKLAVLKDKDMTADDSESDEEIDFSYSSIVDGAYNRWIPSDWEQKILSLQKKGFGVGEKSTWEKWRIFKDNDDVYRLVRYGIITLEELARAPKVIIDALYEDRLILMLEGATVNLSTLLELNESEQGILLDERVLTYMYQMAKKGTTFEELLPFCKSLGNILPHIISIEASDDCIDLEQLKKISRDEPLLNLIRKIIDYKKSVCEEDDGYDIPELIIQNYNKIKDKLDSLCKEVDSLIARGASEGEFEDIVKKTAESSANGSSYSESNEESYFQTSIVYNDPLATNPQIIFDAKEKFGGDFVNFLFRLSEKGLGKQMLDIYQEGGIDAVADAVIAHRLSLHEFDKKPEEKRVPFNKEKVLEKIDHIKTFMTENEENTLSGFAQYVINALSGNYFTKSAIHAISMLSKMLKTLEALLNYGHHTANHENGVTIIITLVEGIFEYIASGQTFAFPMHKPYRFDPDDEPFYSSGISSNDTGENYKGCSLNLIGDFNFTSEV